MIRELDVVVLTKDLPEQSLQAGDAGTVVHRYKRGSGYEVEFVSGVGETVAVLTLRKSDLRELGRREILVHVARPVPLNRRGRTSGWKERKSASA